MRTIIFIVCAFLFFHICILGDEYRFEESRHHIVKVEAGMLSMASLEKYEYRKHEPLYNVCSSRRLEHQTWEGEFSPEVFSPLSISIDEMEPGFFRREALTIQYNHRAETQEFWDLSRIGVENIARDYSFMVLDTYQKAWEEFWDLRVMKVGEYYKHFYTFIPQDVMSEVMEQFLLSLNEIDTASSLAVIVSSYREELEPEHKQFLLCIDQNLELPERLTLRIFIPSEVMNLWGTIYLSLVKVPS